MTWADQLARIRRYLRDPDGRIWSDAALLHLFNDAQRQLREMAAPALQDVQAIRVPAPFQMSYTHDWEWADSEHAIGQVWRVGKDQDASGMVCMFRWEQLFLSSYPYDFTSGFVFQADYLVSEGEDTLEATDVAEDSFPITADDGDFYTQPWEAWYCDTPGDPPPIWVPEMFQEVLYLAHNRSPLEPVTKRALMDGDMTWRTRAGQPQHYWRDEKLSNLIYIYPIPGTISWQDTAGEEEHGFVLHDDENWTDNDKGIGIDFIGMGYAPTSDQGAVIDVVDDDAESLVMVFRREPQDMTGDAMQESDYPSFLQKYLEQIVLARAYGMNNDGNIKSLQQFWTQRAQMGAEAIKQWTIKRLADRDYCLVTKGTPARNTRRHPRLPDNYPAVW